MGKKRKRPARDGCAAKDQANAPSGFRNRHASDSDEGKIHSHPVISLYYRQVVTLRQYLLQRIPVSSRSRRRRIASVRGDTLGEKQENSRLGAHQPQDLAGILDTTLVGVLRESSPTVTQERRRDLAAYSQSQSQCRSELPSTDTGPPCPQSEIVDFVISSLFNRNAFSYQKPQHLLAHGYQRASGPAALTEDGATLTSSIPGLVIQYPNKNVQTLKQAPWTEVLGLLGGNGEEIMLGLLFDCGIFTAIDHRKGIYYQTSGLPLSSLEPITPEPMSIGDSCVNKNVFLSTRSDQGPGHGETNSRKEKSGKNTREVVHKPNSVVFFRRRMLYAKPNLNSRGEVYFGLTHLHVLNRYPRSDSLAQTVHILKYIFPRQFGLHNVFTSVTDSRETVLPFKDYFSRENEIAEIDEQKRKHRRRIGPGFANHYKKQDDFIDIPKRLRGKARELVQQLQNRNRRCPYAELLNYYCPTEDIGPWKLGTVHSKADETGNEPGTAISEPLVTQIRSPHQRPCADAPAPLCRSQENPQICNPLIASSKGETANSRIPKPKLSLMDYATPCSSISAFCRAVLRKLIPPQFYGIGCHQKSNRDIVFRHVDRFVYMRRFESLSLHEVCKGIKITCIPWLEPPANQQGPLSGCKLALSDLQKRTELLHEFIYYIFDSILIPLVRSNFYVTESQSHRNRLFYFRHDVWRRLTQRPLADFKTSLFEEMKRGEAERRLSGRPLGYSSLRLLPKTTGVRPILNLRRRMLKPGWAGKAPFLGPSINSTITPIFNVLNYEKTRNPDSLGSSLSFVGEIHTRLKSFKERLSRSLPDHSPRQPLYFVKVDIQSCFDTIPQESLIPLIESLVSEEGYHIAKHVEVRPPDEFSSMWPLHAHHQSKALRKYVGRAAPVSKPQHFTEAITEGGISHRRNTVFVDTLAHKEYSADHLLDLLDEHIRYNLVKVGKKYFRQRNGIPQGSILSSVLCNLFYAQMERSSLGFLHPDKAVLLRLVDDFLLITSNLSLAMRFLQVMLKGQPHYGITVNPAKSLVNFSATVNGVQIPRLVDSFLFPYCGSLIDTRTLEIYKDQDRVLEGTDSAAATISSSLTVESTRAPGRALHRKVLASFKLQMHPMYLDTKHNSLNVVLSNLYANFVTSAMKMYRYMKALPGRAHPAPEIVARVIKDLMELAHRMIRARRELKSRDHCSPYMCPVQQQQIQYLATAAFRFILGRKQTKYAPVLRWLEQVWKTARPKSGGKAVRLAQVVREGNAVFASWRF